MVELGGVSRSYLQSEGTESVPRLCPTYFWRSRVGALGTWCGDSATGVGDWSRIGGSTPSIGGGRPVLTPWEAGADLVKVRSTES